MSIGIVFSLLGAAVAIGLAGIGSSIGVGIVGRAASGLLAEDGSKFGNALILEALAGSQAIYGFLVAILILQKIGIIGGASVSVTPEQGLALMMAGIPVGFCGLASAIYQGKVAAGGLAILAKDATRGTQGIILASLVETFAILGLLISILILTGVNVG